MSKAKWIGGFLGWVAWGPIGALIGYLLGKAVDTYIDGSHQLPGGDGWEKGRGLTGSRPVKVPTVRPSPARTDIRPMSSGTVSS